MLKCITSITLVQTGELLNHVLSSDITFDCIISEFQVRDLSVPEIIKTIKSDSRLRNIPFIVLTSYDYPENLKICTENGADMVIIKPSDFYEYVNMIERILEIIDA